MLGRQPTSPPQENSNRARCACACASLPHFAQTLEPPCELGARALLCLNILFHKLSGRCCNNFRAEASSCGSGDPEPT